MLAKSSSMSSSEWKRLENHCYRRSKAIDNGQWKIVEMNAEEEEVIYLLYNISFEKYR